MPDEAHVDIGAHLASVAAHGHAAGRAKKVGAPLPLVFKREVKKHERGGVDLHILEQRIMMQTHESAAGGNVHDLGTGLHFRRIAGDGVQHDRPLDRQDGREPETGRIELRGRGAVARMPPQLALHTTKRRLDLQGKQLPPGVRPDGRSPFRCGTGRHERRLAVKAVPASRKPLLGRQHEIAGRKRHAHVRPLDGLTGFRLPDLEIQTAFLLRERLRQCSRPAQQRGAVSVHLQETALHRPQLARPVRITEADEGPLLYGAQQGRRDGRTPQAKILFAGRRLILFCHHGMFRFRGCSPYHRRCKGALPRPAA